MINFRITTKSIILTLGCSLSIPLLSQPVGQQTVVVLDPVADSGISNQFLRSIRNTLEESIARSRAYRVVDRARTDQVLSEISYQSNGRINRDGVMGIGAMLAANIVCLPEIRMDDKGFINIIISLTDMESRLTTKYENDPVPRDNAIAINSSINELAAQAFGATALSGQNARQAGSDRATTRQDRALAQAEREARASERQMVAASARSHGAAEEERLVWEAEFLTWVPMAKEVRDEYPLGIGAAAGGEIAFNDFIGLRGKAELGFAGYLPSKDYKAYTVGTMVEGIFGSIGRPGIYGFAGGGFELESAKWEDNNTSTFASGGFGWRFLEDWGASARYTRYFGDMKDHEMVEASVTFRNAPFEKFGKTGPYGYASYGLMDPGKEETGMASVGFGWRFTKHLGAMASYTFTLSPSGYEDEGILGASFVYRAPAGKRTTSHHVHRPVQTVTYERPVNEEHRADPEVARAEERARQEQSERQAADRAAAESYRIPDEPRTNRSPQRYSALENKKVLLEDAMGGSRTFTKLGDNLALGDFLGVEIAFNRFFGLKVELDGKYIEDVGGSNDGFIRSVISTNAYVGSVGRTGPYGFIGGGVEMDLDTDDENLTSSFATGGFGWRFTEDWGASSRYTRYFGDMKDTEVVDASVTYKNGPFERFGKTGLYGFARYRRIMYPNIWVEFPGLPGSGFVISGEDIDEVSVGIGWRFTKWLGAQTSYTMRIDYPSAYDAVDASVVVRFGFGKLR